MEDLAAAYAKSELTGMMGTVVDDLLQKSPDSSEWGLEQKCFQGRCPEVCARCGSSARSFGSCTWSALVETCVHMLRRFDKVSQLAHACERGERERD